jgi:hypothetical protein
MKHTREPDVASPKDEEQSRPFGGCRPGGIVIQGGTAAVETADIRPNVSNGILPLERFPLTARGYPNQ